jgi:phage shock protein A
MAILSRISARPKSPECLLANTIRDLDQDLAHARRQAAVAIAGERLLAWEREQNRRAAEFWRRKVCEARAAGQEGLARRAHIRWEDQENLAEDLAALHENARRAAEEARALLGTCEARLSAARGDQRLLSAGLDCLGPPYPAGSVKDAVSLILFFVFFVFFVVICL